MQNLFGSKDDSTRDYCLVVLNNFWAQCKPHWKLNFTNPPLPMPPLGNFTYDDNHNCTDHQNNSTVCKTDMSQQTVIVVESVMLVLVVIGYLLYWLYTKPKSHQKPPLATSTPAAHHWKTTSRQNRQMPSRSLERIVEKTEDVGESTHRAGV